MSISFNNLGGYLQSVWSTALQNSGVSTSGASQSSSAGTAQFPADNSQLSPFAQLLSTLQQLQQSDPAKYQQVTQQIATNLQSAAQTAQSGGNTSAANELTQLSTDFSNASQSGQLPNIQDLAEAIGGGHRHHHAHTHHFLGPRIDIGGSSDSTSSSVSSSGSTSTGDAGSTTSSITPSTVAQPDSGFMNPLLSFSQPAAAQSESLQPMAIIMNTLAGAGISIS